ncbi:MAG: DNA polymerase III subunit alpha, partial [Burkholderiales bacterium]|nr:DNA polymerase III subunit alpha [Burkholderiales bacterium]
SDGTGSQEVTVYNEVFDLARDLIKEDAILVLEVKIRAFRRGGEDNDGTLGMRIAAEKVYDVAGARARFSKGLRLSMNGEANAQRLRQLLTPYRNAHGSCPVRISYRNGQARCDVWLGDDWRVVPDEKLVRSLHEWLTPAGVEFIYS